MVAQLFSNHARGGVPVASQYAVVLIKPDAVRDILEEMIIQDLREAAFVEPIFRKYWRVTEGTARLIYRDWIGTLEFPSMARNITQGPSLFVVAEGDGNIYEALKRVKGKMNLGGLRLKYRTRSIEEWKALGYSGRELQNRIAENRLHTTDNFAATVYLCSLALNAADVTTLEARASHLATAIRRSTAMQLWTARPETVP